MSDHEELEMSLAAWVLGAMTADEADEMRLHIDGCTSCRETTARMERATGALPLAVDEVAPPARLRERVLTGAAATRTSAGSAGTAIAPAPRRTEPRRPSRVTPIAPAPRPRIPVFAMAAAVLLALLVGVVAGDLLGRSAVPPPATAVARYTIVGSQELAGARASVIDLKSDGVTLVDFTGLPPVPSGKVYEVWLITPSGRADPAAVFVPDSNGSKVVVVNQSLSGYSVMAVTREVGPSGTTAPTEQPQMAGKLA
jgi:anti-sigma-K factor RskA